MGLVTFLRARLDEREAAAKAAGISTMHVFLAKQSGKAAWSTFIALNDPAHVLADIAAKRRVMARHQTYADRFPDDVEPGVDRRECIWCGYRRDGDPYTPDINRCPELLDLAAPFAQHPDYDPAWAAEGTVTT